MEGSKCNQNHKVALMYGTYDVASGSNQNFSKLKNLLFFQMNRKQNLHWKRITVKNLNLDYIRLFSKSEAVALFQEAGKGIKYNANSKVLFMGSGTRFQESKLLMEMQV